MNLYLRLIIETITIMLLWSFLVLSTLPTYESPPELYPFIHEEVQGIEVDMEEEVTLEEEDYVDYESDDESDDVSNPKPIQTQPNPIVDSPTVPIDVNSSEGLYYNPNPIDRYHPEFLFELGPGINLAGAEFAPNNMEYQHIYPTSSIPYFHSKGVKLIRLPFLWERMQPNLYGELSSSEITMMNSFLDVAQEYGMYVILDLHNYNRYKGELVGSTAVPASALGDLWSKMATIYSDNPTVIAYGIMNEPHSTGGTWHTTAQITVDAIRTVDTNMLILVAGDTWSSAWGWQYNNPNLDINDPYRRILFEAHIYFDSYNQGIYSCNYDSCGTSKAMIDERMSSFLFWLNQKQAYGFIGEYGVPSDDSRWYELMEYFLEILDENRLGSTAWAAGPNWGNYVLSLEPRLNEWGIFEDRPLMNLITKYNNKCEVLPNGIVSGECLFRLRNISDEEYLWVE